MMLLPFAATRAVDEHEEQIVFQYGKAYDGDTMPTQSSINAVLDVLQQKEYLPSDLLRELLKRGFEESDVKEAVAQLLHDQALEFTANRHLHIAAAIA